MTARIIAAIVMSVVLAGCGRQARGPEKYDLTDALRRLTDVSLFAVDPEGKAGMVSTWDRSGGNEDRAEWPSVAADGTVEIANLKGPGCLTRLWTTGGSDDQREWLFYIDGERDARLAARPIPGGTFTGAAPFVPPLASELSGADHSYLPLPYRNSLRVVLRFKGYKAGKGPYYHLNYTTFRAGTDVTSYPDRLTERDEHALTAARDAWSQYNQPVLARSHAALLPQTNTILVAASTQATLGRFEGGGVIKTIALRLRPSGAPTAAAMARLTRELILHAYWDNAEAPSIDVPLGDFFCNGLKWRRFSSLPLEKQGDLLVCRFPMPFRQSARLELENDSPVAVEVDAAFEVDNASGGEGVNYLHASWRQTTRSGAPFRFFDAKGRGHYVGCYLISLGMDGTWNNMEADESFSVDGEMSPSFHGTGLEDYFNGGWYYYGLYDLPLCGLVEKAAMQTAQYRFHLPDRIGFMKGISGEFEFGDGNRSQGYMSAVAYWYQDRPMPAGSVIPSPVDRFPPPNQVERAATMAELMELERIGLFEEAAERCAIFAERYAGTPEAGIYLLRQAAYRERMSGAEAARAAYQAVMKSRPDSIEAKQAQLLLWYDMAQTNAIAFGHVNGEYKVYLDGRLILQGDHPLALSAAPLQVAAGEHELTAEVTAKRSLTWFRFTLRMHGADLATDESWMVSMARPAEWPLAGDGEAGWNRAVLHVVPPFMSYWAFSPNAFVGAQEGRHFIIGPGDWKPGTTVFLRKRFVAP